MSGQGDAAWNTQGLPAGDSAAGTQFHQTFFSPSQVTVNNGLTLTMVPDSKYSSLGYKYRSGVVTTEEKFTLRSGYVQIKAKMSDASQGGWPAIWFIDPTDGRGSQEIDLQEGGFTAKSLGLPSGTPENNIFVSTYHTPSGSQSDFTHVTRKPLNAGLMSTGCSTSLAARSRRISMASWSARGPRTSALPLMRSSSGTPRQVPIPRVFTR